MSAQQITTARAWHSTRLNTASAHGRGRWRGDELAHIRCEPSGVRLGEDSRRGRKETEAEGVAHLCCQAPGLDTQLDRDAYVFGWAKRDMDLIEQHAWTVLRVGKAILADLTPLPRPRLHRHPTTRVDRAREAMPNIAAASLEQRQADLVTRPPGDEQ
jgi:hypothetical protein